jgi:polysaccharide biosynthesis protein PelE
MSPAPSASRDCRWSVATIAATVLATAAEIGIVVAGLVNVAPFPVLAAAHVGVGLSLFLGLALPTVRGRDNPTFLLFIICILAMGPLGPLGIALIVVLRRSFARRATSFEDWYAALFPRITATPTQTLYERIVLRGGGPTRRSTVTSFMDVMAFGTVPQKQAVIAMATDGFCPMFAPALQSALNDAEPAIRVQAATAFARIEGRFLNRSVALQARRLERPDDADVLLELARHHEECADSGVLDDGRAQVALEDALACYERVDDLRPGASVVAEPSARLLLRLGRAEEAMLRLQPLVARSDASPETLTGYLACLFRRGQFGHLREASRTPGVGRTSPDLRKGAERRRHDRRQGGNYVGDGPCPDQRRGVGLSRDAAGRRGLVNRRIILAYLPDIVGEALRLWSGDAAKPIAAAETCEVPSIIAPVATVRPPPRNRSCPALALPAVSNQDFARHDFCHA